jgi:uncharacterized protein
MKAKERYSYNNAARFLKVTKKRNLTDIMGDKVIKTNMQIITPIQPKERAEVLDVLRGFALLGICIANAGYFSLYIFQKPDQLALLSTAPVDTWLKHFEFAFIVGKFYSLFSLLFGIGFAIIFFQKNAGTKKGLYFFYRRLFFLMLFGLIHSFLIWDGDILFFYAIAGALLPLFRNSSDKTLVSLFVLLIISSLFIDMLKVISDGNWNMSKAFFEIATHYDKQAGITENNIPTWLIVNDSYKDLLGWNRSGFWWSWQFRLDSNRFLNVLAMFLLGLYIGRKKIYSKLSEYKPLLRRVQLLGLGIGIPAGIAYAYFNVDGKSLPTSAGMWDTFSYELNVATLSIGYAATIALWYINNTNNKLLQWLQPVGQMALTNYLAQTVFGISIYYGIGAGLGANIGPSFFIPLAIDIFILQVIYSNIWLKYFNYGPLEWVWRSLTYGKKQPMKKTIAKKIIL